MRIKNYIVYIAREWTAGRDIIKNTHEEVLGEKISEKKGWMSDTTWQRVEERRKMKEKVNNAKTVHKGMITCQNK